VCLRPVQWYVGRVAGPSYASKKQNRYKREKRKVEKLMPIVGAFQQSVSSLQMFAFNFSNVVQV